MLLEVAADKLIRDADFEAVVPVPQQPGRPDPGVERLGRELAV
jgi:hypothetical protein